MNVSMSVPYRSTHRSSDYDDTFTSSKHVRVVKEIKKKFNCTSWNT